jgi:hypothetical protein
MSDDPLLQRIREEWSPDPVDPDGFAARVRTKARRRHRVQVGTALVGTLLACIAAMMWLQRDVHDRRIPIETVAASSTPIPAPEAEGTTTAALQIAGLATAADGTPLAGATITAGDVTVTADESGRFIISARPGETVRVHKEGWSTAWARVHGDEPLTIASLPSGSLGVLPAATGGTLVGPDGFTLTLAPDSVQTASGEPYDGDVHVRWSLLRRPDQMAAAPGDLATVVNGAEVPLESFGMAEVVLTDPSGNELDLRAAAEIRVPLSDAHPFSEGQEVGLYAYDEIAGLWTDEGRGVVQDGKMLAQVGHFSWWNADAPLTDTGCVCGTARFAGAGLLTVHAVGETYLAKASTLTDPDDGSFCLDVKASAPVHLEVRSPRGDGCLTGRSGTVVASEAGTSVEIDQAKCARADLDVVAGPCPSESPRSPEPREASAEEPRLEIIRGGTAEELREQREASIRERRERLGDRVVVKMGWRSAGHPENDTTLRWRCDQGAWNESQVGVLGSWRGPLPDGASCEMEVGGESYRFVVEDGLEIRCVQEAGCFVVSDERPRSIAVPLREDARIRLEWEPGDAPEALRGATLKCGDRLEEIAPSADGGEIVLTVPRETFCWIDAGDQGIGFNLYEDTTVTCRYGEHCRPEPR